MISKSLPLFFNRTLLEQTGIEEYVFWNYERLPHALVVGATGSGKTYAVKLFLAKISKYIPDAKITVCDFKADPDDFGVLANCPRYFTFMNCQNGLDTFYDAFQLRQQGKDKSKSFRLLICEEWASLLNVLQKKESEAAKLKLATLLMLGRSYNFHIMVNQQRADAQYFSTARDNFNVIIALGNVSKESAAMLGFDRDQMKPVSKQGTGYMLANGTDLQAIQVPRITNTAKLTRYMIDAVSR